MEDNGITVMFVDGKVLTFPKASGGYTLSEKDFVTFMNKEGTENHYRLSPVSIRKEEIKIMGDSKILREVFTREE